MARAGAGWVVVLLLLLAASSSSDASKLAPAAAPPATSTAGWIWPLPHHPDGRAPTVSDHYGFSAARGRLHAGVDLMYERPRGAWLPKGTRYPLADGSHGSRGYELAEGTPVRAARAGKVRVANVTKRGHQVVLDHGGGWQTFYQHLASLAVAKGDQVAAGQALGEAGWSPIDRSQIRHLHFELWESGDPIDPEGIMRAWAP